MRRRRVERGHGREQPGAGVAPQIHRRAHEQLAEKGITVGRSYVNEYCTSLDMAGASITLVKLDDEIEELLNAPAEVPIRVF